MMMPVKYHQNQGQRLPLGSLRSLCVVNDNAFISVFNSSKLQLGLGDGLAFLEKLVIDRCSNILRWPVDEFRCLVGLRSLHINCCNKLEGKGSSSEEILPLPQLERLNIQSCDSLLEIPKLPASLGELSIGCCNSLVALPSNLGDLAKLRHLALRGCPDLQRRCREGGEYFDFVSPIPDKNIPAAREPQMKRFLPLCGGGDSQSN